ncbi:F-box protein [Cardamine amara subsp. amara]|uniref:F-box protein n=1 Tax=Cardamine amara subsp. amara TaxID=228776 RepID=A0ABD1BC27_CARAN
MEASSSRNLDPARNYITTIFFYLTFEILSRLPAKSLIRFQSVSNLWFSIISGKYFVDSFFTRSKTRPRLLFSFKFKHLDIPKHFIFSAPEHINKGEQNLPSHGTTRHGDLGIGLQHQISPRKRLCLLQTWFFDRCL